MAQDFDASAAGRPHGVSSRSGPTGDTTYAYDDSGNLASVERPAGAARPDQYLEFDSADRLVCVSSTASETCDVLRVAYDAAGSRVRETTAEVTRRFVREQVRTYYADGSVEDRAEIFAFGELVAYLHARPVPEVAGGPALLVFDLEVPGWGLALLPLSVLLMGLGLALRGGLLVGVARRPGYAGLSGVLIVSLVVAPYPVAGGGGSANEVVYRWVLADRLGSALTEVDVEGEILRQARFKPFGGLDHEVQLSSPSERRRIYAGHAEQEETGFFYMQARWMDPETGTFLSVDPVVPSAGDPQSFNAYAYARNNPVTHTDPSGMCVIMSHCVTISPGGLGYGKAPQYDLYGQPVKADISGESPLERTREWEGMGVASDQDDQDQAGRSAQESQVDVLPNPVTAEKTAIGDAFGNAIERPDSAKDLATVQAGRDFLNDAINAGDLKVPWLKDANIEGIQYDSRSIPRGNGEFVGGAVRRGPSNNSPIVVFYDGASSVQMAVRVIAHELGHFNTSFTHAQIYEFGETAAALYGRSR